MDEAALKDRLDPRQKQVMHDPIAKIRRKDLPGFAPVAYKADRGAGAVGVGKKLFPKPEQGCFRIDLEGEGVTGTTPGTSTGAIGPPEVFEGIQFAGKGVAGGRRNCGSVRFQEKAKQFPLPSGKGAVVQEPDRTARTEPLYVLPPLSVSPLPKYTSHAFDG